MALYLLVRDQKTAEPPRKKRKSPIPLERSIQSAPPAPPSPPPRLPTSPPLPPPRPPSPRPGPSRPPKRKAAEYAMEAISEINAWLRHERITARRSERRVRVIIEDDSPASSQTSEEPDEYYPVEEILNERRVNGRRELLLRWRGYAEPSWEPVEHLNRCAELLSIFDRDFDEVFDEDD